MICVLWVIISPTNTYGTGLYFFRELRKARSPQLDELAHLIENQCNLKKTKFVSLFVEKSKKFSKKFKNAFDYMRIWFDFDKSRKKRIKKTLSLSLLLIVDLFDSQSE